METHHIRLKKQWNRKLTTIVSMNYTKMELMTMFINWMIIHLNVD